MFQEFKNFSEYKSTEKRKSRKQDHKERVKRKGREQEHRERVENKST